MKKLLLPLLLISTSLLAMDCATEQTDETLTHPAAVSKEETVQFNSDPLNNALLNKAWYGASTDEINAFCAEHPEVNLNARSETIFPGYTPLHFACMGGHEETSRALINQGACLRAIDGGISPLSVAISKGNAPICQMLMEHKETDVSDQTVQEYAEKVASLGHEAILPLLIISGYKINYKRLLKVAVENGQQGMVQLLHTLGVRIGEADTELLFAAALGGLEEPCRTLLDLGTEVNPRDDLGHTPLCWAIDRLKRLKRLQDRGLLRSDEFVKKEQYERVCALLTERGGIDKVILPIDFTQTWKFYLGIKALKHSLQLYGWYKKISSCCTCPKKGKRE